MKWAMSQDYVAIMTTVILAELAISSVLIYQFLKPSMAPRPVERVREETRSRPRGRPPREFGFYLRFAVLLGWFLLAWKLSFLEMDMLSWSGHEHPEGTGTDPYLAKSAFFWASLALMVMVVEALLKLLMDGARSAAAMQEPVEEDGPRANPTGEPPQQPVLNPREEAPEAEGSTS